MRSRYPLRGAGPGPQSGFTLLELMAVLFLSTILALVSVNMLTDYFRAAQTESAAMTIQNCVWSARFKALKAKTRHRVLLHDENDATPNVVELQEDESGTFVTLPQKIYTLPATVDIVGGSPNDSADSVIIGPRGECDEGYVYLRGHNGEIKTISITTNCLADLL